MKFTKPITIAALLIIMATQSGFAQKTVPAAGGNGIGVGGTSSYTAGQIEYETISGSNGSAALGVQQPFEISVLTGPGVTEEVIGYKVYPNPTDKDLFLFVETELTQATTYELFDWQGMFLEQTLVNEDRNIISMEAYPSGVYVLRVSSAGQTAKIFRIVKNQ